MGTCACDPPALLHLRPDGVHLPDGSPSNLTVVDDVWDLGNRSCSVCAMSITDAHYGCVRCDAVICRACISDDTIVVECDCLTEPQVTGVQRAARRVAAAHAG